MIHSVQQICLELNVLSPALVTDSPSSSYQMSRPQLPSSAYSWTAQCLFVIAALLSAAKLNTRWMVQCVQCGRISPWSPHLIILTSSLWLRSLQMLSVERLLLLQYGGEATVTLQSASLFSTLNAWNKERKKALMNSQFLTALHLSPPNPPP